MKKDSKPGESPKGQQETKIPQGERITVGMDLGDKTSHYCVLASNGEKLYEGKVASTKEGMTKVFSALGSCRIAIEAGTHSPWVSRLLTGLGHEAIVANPRQVRLISQSSRKDDKLDARTLARLARIDPLLLRPIRHRSEKAQLHLTRIRARAALVEARTALVNAARGMAKALTGTAGAVRRGHHGPASAGRFADGDSTSAAAVAGRGGVADGKDSGQR
jgi:transposase